MGRRSREPGSEWTDPWCKVDDGLRGGTVLFSWVPCPRRAAGGQERSPDRRARVARPPILAGISGCARPTILTAGPPSTPRCSVSASLCASLSLPSELIHPDPGDGQHASDLRKLDREDSHWTRCARLGVKGSQVQILSARPEFRRSERCRRFSAAALLPFDSNRDSNAAPDSNRDSPTACTARGRSLNLHSVQVRLDVAVGWSQSGTVEPQPANVGRTTRTTHADPRWQASDLQDRATSSTPLEDGSQPPHGPCPVTALGLRDATKAENARARLSTACANHFRWLGRVAARSPQNSEMRFVQ